MTPFMFAILMLAITFYGTMMLPVHNLRGWIVGIALSGIVLAIINLVVVILV